MIELQPYGQGSTIRALRAVALSVGFLSWIWASAEASGSWPSVPPGFRGSTLFERLLLSDMEKTLTTLREALYHYQRLRGELPLKLRELGDLEEVFHWPPSPDFYRIIDDRGTYYRYVYQPKDPDLALVAQPREQPDRRLAFGVLREKLRFSRRRNAGQEAIIAGLVSGPVTKDAFSWEAAFGLVSEVCQVPQPGGDYKELDWSRRVENEALPMMWAIQEAQETHAYLEQGRYASSLDELTSALPGRSFPILATSFHRCRKAYELRFGGDGSGWWVEAHPKSGATMDAGSKREEPSRPELPAYYRFRVSRGQPISFAPAGTDEPWKPITEVP